MAHSAFGWSCPPGCSGPPDEPDFSVTVFPDRHIKKVRKEGVRCHECGVVLTGQPARYQRGKFDDTGEFFSHWICSGPCPWPDDDTDVWADAKEATP